MSEYINYSTARIIEVPALPFDMPLTEPIASTSDAKKRKPDDGDVVEVERDGDDDDDDDDDGEFQGKKKRAPKKPSRDAKQPKTGVKKPRKPKDDIADEFSSMSLPALKARAKELGLKLGGNKPDLLARLRGGGVEVAPYPPAEAASKNSYDLDQPEKAYGLEKAKSARVKCVRCLRSIDKGALKVFFETVETTGATSRPVVRSYHHTCFAAYPPKGIHDVNQIKWMDSAKTGGSAKYVRNPELEAQFKAKWAPVKLDGVTGSVAAQANADEAAAAAAQPSTNANAATNDNDDDDDDDGGDDGDDE